MAKQAPTLAVIDDGEGGKLLESTQTSTITQAQLQAQKAVIQTWREGEEARHAARLDVLDGRETAVDAKIAMFS